MKDFSGWAQHLQHPLVLAGFALVITVALVQVLVSKGIVRLSRQASETLVQRTLLLAFSLGLVTVVLAFWLASAREKSAFQSQSPPNQGEKRSVEPRPVQSEAPAEQSGGSPAASQQSTGAQSPNVIGKDVRIEYGKK